MSNEIDEAKRKYRLLNQLKDEQICDWAKVEQSTVAQWRLDGIVVMMICTLSAAIGEDADHYIFTSKDGKALIVDKVGDVGHPPIPTGELLAKIEPYLKLGYTLRRCGALANIPHLTLYSRYDNDEDFRTKVDAFREYMNVMARTVIGGTINAGDADAALGWLENTDPDFGKKQKMILDGEIGITKNEMTPEQKAKLEAVLADVTALQKSHANDGLVTPGTRDEDSAG